MLFEFIVSFVFVSYFGVLILVLKEDTLREEQKPAEWSEEDES